MNLLLLLLSCQSSNDVDQQCFLDYLDDARTNTGVYFECQDAGDPTATCADDLASSSSSAMDTLGGCAGDGCITEWMGCIEDSNDISCYDDLEQCGGWVNTGMVDDCNSDINFCGNSKGCSDDYYDCLIYAAGG